MSRHIGGAIAAIAVTVLAACSEATAPQPVSQIPARMSGGGGGGSGGVGSIGGGGGGGTRQCALLSVNIINNVLLGIAVPSFWLPNSGYVAQVSGTAEKSCDAIGGATITFEDLTGTNDGCALAISPWVNNPFYLNPKYGAKPMSRFVESFIYYTGADCIGHPHTFKATLTDPSAGGVTTSASITWTP